MLPNFKLRFSKPLEDNVKLGLMTTNRADNLYIDVPLI